MGRVIRREVIAMRCELTECGEIWPIAPIPLSSALSAPNEYLGELVEQGWGFVLTPRVRSYCPRHTSRVWACTCRTNPDRAHLCTRHNPEVAELVWCPGAQRSGLSEAREPEVVRAAA